LRHAVSRVVGVPFNHLADGGIDDFSSFFRLGGSAHGPLSFCELGRSYQPPTLYANFIFDLSWLLRLTLRDDGRLRTEGASGYNLTEESEVLRERWLCDYEGCAKE